jgi:hypothetical protein
MQETPLSGGQMTSVVKIGDTVHRAASKWTPAVNQLLRHLESINFEGVPRVLGKDDNGRQVLSFIDGEAGYFDQHGTVPKNLWSDGVLVGAAEFLRRYHDATAAFVAKPGTHWQFRHSDSKDREVICHNDFGPWNSIFVNGQFKAIIDFDTAGPGRRIDDIAYAVYSFAPLFREEKCPKVGLATPPDYGRKLKLFCDSYGREYCDGIVEAIIDRIASIRTWVIKEADAGDPRFQSKVKEGHVSDYDADLAFLRAHQDKLELSQS